MSVIAAVLAVLDTLLIPNEKTTSLLDATTCRVYIQWLTVYLLRKSPCYSILLVVFVLVFLDTFFIPNEKTTSLLDATTGLIVFS